MGVDYRYKRRKFNSHTEPSGISATALSGEDLEWKLTVDDEYVYGIHFESDFAFMGINV